MLFSFAALFETGMAGTPDARKEGVMSTIQVGIRVWLKSDSNFTFGPGQAELLRRVMELGSLRKAAGHMGMSYRRAWGRIKKMEQALGEPMVYKPGGNKSGFKLTPVAHNLVQGFEAWSESVALFADAKALEVLPKGFHPSPEKKKTP